MRISHGVDINGSSVRLDVGDEVVLLGKSQNGGFDLEPFGSFRFKLAASDRMAVGRNSVLMVVR